MAPNKRKILEAARKFAQKGQKERSLKEYEKLLKLDPRDAKLRLEIGDAHRRWGQVGEAIAAYTRVADQYMAEGFDARAVAVFKQIQNLDPEHYEAYVPLSELYERMGLTSEAIQALQTAADGLHKAGKKPQALDLLRRMAALDPTNTSSRVKVADLLRQEGLTSDAVSEYDAARAELEKQGEHEAAGNVLERILEAEPDRLETIVALAQNLLKRGQGDAAEALAKRALETDDQEPAHYELLADVCRVRGRDDELKDTYKRLAELYRQRGDDDRARDLIQRFVPMEDFGAALDNTQPNDLDAGLVGGMGTMDLPQPGGLDAPAGDPDSEGPAEELLEDEILMDQPVEPGPRKPLIEETVLELGEDPEPEILLDTPQPRELDEEPPPPPVEGDSDQLLAEASVYLRYGKRDQAIRNLEAVVEREPGHRAALEKLGEAYADGGETSAAVDTWMRAAELSREAGDSEGLAVLRDRIAALDQTAAAGLGPELSELASGAAEPDDELDDLIDVEDVAQEPEVESSAAGELDLDDDIDIDVDIDIDAIAMEDDVDPEEVAATEVPELEEVEFDASEVELEASEDEAVSGGAAERVPSTSTTQQIQEELEEAAFYHQQGLTAEARAIYQRVLELAPNHPLALVRMGELDSDAGGDPDLSVSGDLDVSAGGDIDVSTSGDLDVSASGDFDVSAGGDLDMSASGLDVPSLEADARADGDAAAEDSGDIGRDLADWSEDDLGAEIEIEDPDDVEMPDEVGIDLEPDVPGDTAPELDLGMDESAEAGPSPADTGGGGVSTDTLADDDELLPPDPDTVVSEPEPEPEPEPVEPEPEPLVAEPEPPLPPQTPEPLAPPAMASEGATFDLAAELSDALDDGPEASASGLAQLDDDGFSAVFREFKKGVSKALDEGDHEAHWDLGIAYREMGLLEDAIGEFEVALTSLARRIDGLHMIAVCTLDLGHADDAAARLEEALACAGLREEQLMALRFDLGRAYEAQGRIDAARATWQAVAAADASFCDVGERLMGLGEAKPDSDPAQEYESFGDLIDDDDDTAEEAIDAGHESFEDLIAEVSSEAEATAAAGAAGPDPGDAIADAAPTSAAGGSDLGVAAADLGDTLSKDAGDTLSNGPGDTLSNGPGDTLSGGAGDSASSEPGDSAAGKKSKPRRNKKISFV